MALITSTVAGTIIAVASPIMDVTAVSYGLGVCAPFLYPKEAGLAPSLVVGIVGWEGRKNGSIGGSWVYD